MDLGSFCALILSLGTDQLSILLDEFIDLCLRVLIKERNLSLVVNHLGYETHHFNGLYFVNLRVFNLVSFLILDLVYLFHDGFLKIEMPILPIQSVLFNHMLIFIAALAIAAAWRLVASALRVGSLRFILLVPLNEVVVCDSVTKLRPNSRLFDDRIIALAILYFESYER